MKKAVFLTILGLIIIIGILAGIKIWQIRAMIAKGKQFVTTARNRYLGAGNLR